MSQNVFLEEAKKVATEAIALDNAGEYEQAYRKYQDALDQFMLMIKYEKNEKARDVIRKKAEDYLKRAEAIKKMLIQKTEKEAIETAEGKPDAEFKRLERALQDAIVKEKPNVKWSDVAGLEPTKVALKEAVILPVKFPQFFSAENPPWKGILLYGPPGTGKSYLAKAVATESDSTFFSISAADMGSKWHGESEKLVRTLFQMARLMAPSIVFIDEVDSLCGARGEGQSDVSQKVKTEFLRQMDGIGSSDTNKHRLLVLGATNLPWALDTAIRRRFEKRIYVPLPDSIGRKRMFQLKVGSARTDLTDSDFEYLAKHSVDYSGADIAIVVREALMMPLREYQTASFFVEDPEGFLVPSEKSPPCPRCPIIDSATPLVEPTDLKSRTCETCHALRISLFDAPSEKFRAPLVKTEYFKKALAGITASVGKTELKEFISWTKQFGEDGSEK